jgi:hypothetical protein
VVLGEAEHVGVERESCSLVVYIDAGQLDSGRSFLAKSQRWVMAASGSLLK